MSNAPDGFLQENALKPSIWHRLGFCRPWDEDLFEWRNAEPGQEDWWVEGTITTNTVVHVDWLDRLRILISGKCRVESFTRTSVTVAHAETRSIFSVLPPRADQP